MSKGDDLIDVAFEPEGLEPDFGFEQSREFGSRMPEQDHQGLSRILFFFLLHSLFTSFIRSRCRVLGGGGDTSNT